MRAGEAPQLDQPAGGVAVDPAAPVGRHVVEQRVADEAVAEAVAGAGRLDDRARRARRRGGRTPRPPASPDSATNSSVSNDEPTTATRCSTSRVAGAMPPIMLASSACTHSRLVGRAPGELVDRERDAPAERRDLLEQLGGRVGDVARARASAMSVAAERAELELDRAVPVDQALARLGQRVGQSGAGRWASTMHTRSSRVERAM